jgi:hypothetical protein
LAVSDSAEGNAKDCSLPMQDIMGLAMLMSLALVAVPTAAYAVLWGWERLKGGFHHELLVVALVFVLGTAAHEFIHGVSWSLFGRMPLRRIKFGFQWKTATPYAHPRQPMPVTAYRWGTVMPLLTLGLIPCALSLLTGNANQFAFGFLFTMVAGGDLVVLWLLRGVSATSRVEDHPTNAGCLVYEG